MSGWTRMGRNWSILHTFILFFILDHHAGCNARMWRMTADMEEVAEVVHSSSLSLLHRRQLQSAAYCVAISSADQTQLQTALDWACSAAGGKVDCSPLQEGGSCYTPNTLTDHASYAFDVYYVAQNGATNSCSFGGVATPTSTKPTTSSSCNYPALGGSTGTTNSTSPVTSGTPPPPSTSTSTDNTTSISPGTFDNTTTSGTTSYSTPSPIAPPWLHALCGGTILILLLKL